MNALGIVDWNSVANAATAIGGAVQTGTSAYTTINNSINAGKSQNPAVQQYLTPPAPVPLPGTKNTLMYVAVGGLGLLLIGGIVYAATKK